MDNITGDWEDDAENKKECFMLRLFVTGASANSVRAIANLKATCEEHLQGRYNLEIIDIHQQAALAEKEQIIALPLLIKSSPPPERRMIGDMSDTPKLLRGLGITQ